MPEGLLNHRSAPSLPPVPLAPTASEHKSMSSVGHCLPASPSRFLPQVPELTTHTCPLNHSRGCSETSLSDWPSHSPVPPSGLGNDTRYPDLAQAPDQKLFFLSLLSFHCTPLADSVTSTFKTDIKSIQLSPYAATPSG